MTRRIFFDLDGTLIDPRRRLYNLFQELVPECGLSFDDYWLLKRGGASQRHLLAKFGYSDAQMDIFRTAWMEKVEEPERLTADTPFPGVADFLAQASSAFDLYLVTARQHADRLAAQIGWLGWNGWFAEIATTAQRESKADLIRSQLPFGDGDMLVGDTREDVVAGKELGLYTVAVASGMVSAAILRNCEPDRLLDSVTELRDVLFPLQKETTA